MCILSPPLAALLTFELPCDAITFSTVLYNFSIVGVMAIFYQTGIPMIITQSYLVATTVILAWNLSKFDEWTCWALLVALAFWDLCAVLTPCGPLQMLVEDICIACTTSLSHIFKY